MLGSRIHRASCQLPPDRHQWELNISELKGMSPNHSFQQPTAVRSTIMRQKSTVEKVLSSAQLNGLQTLCLRISLYAPFVCSPKIVIGWTGRSKSVTEIEEAAAILARPSDCIAIAKVSPAETCPGSINLKGIPAPLSYLWCVESQAEVDTSYR
eukprot:SAG31_NODE_557_length_14160_cov_18.420880_8_plen_154_part_00